MNNLQPDTAHGATAPMCQEIWVDAYGLAGFYQVSSLGNVRSIDRAIMRKDGAVISYKGQSIKLKFNRITGYLYFESSTAGKRRTVYAHVLVCDTFYGPCPKGYERHHMDTNRCNNRADNFEILCADDHRLLHQLLH